jgi:glycine/D-amino acid oxidase-like deaminating enzyme
VQGTSCEVECDRVLLAINAYAPLFELGFVEKLTPIRGQILVTKPLWERVLDRICYANYGWEYFRQLPDNRLLLGGCREQFLDQEIGYSDVVSRPVQSALESYLKDRFPDIAGVRIDYRFSGVMGFTADGLPLVGETKKTPGMFYAMGCNGHGFSYGLNLSRLLVDCAIDGKSAGIFDAERTPNLVASAGRNKKGP